jgi:hypothetical protein
MASNIRRGGQLRQPVSYPYPAPTLAAAAPRIRRRTLSASDSLRNTVVVGGQADAQQNGADPVDQSSDLHLAASPESGWR